MSQSHKTNNKTRSELDSVGKGDQNLRHGKRFEFFFYFYFRF